MWSNVSSESCKADRHKLKHFINSEYAAHLDSKIIEVTISRNMVTLRLLFSYIASAHHCIPVAVVCIILGYHGLDFRVFVTQLADLPVVFQMRKIAVWWNANIVLWSAWCTSAMHFLSATYPLIAFKRK